MKKLIPLLTLAISAGLVLLVPQQARSENAGACYTVGDADARAYCLARAHKDPGRCYAIQRPDTRSACLAEVRK